MIDKRAELFPPHWNPQTVPRLYPTAKGLESLAVFQLTIAVLSHARDDYSNNTWFLRFILSQGPKVNSPLIISHSGPGILTKAITVGAGIELVKLLVEEAGADVNEKGPDSLSPLGAAAGAHSLEIVRNLLF